MRVLQIGSHDDEVCFRRDPGKRRVLAGCDAGDVRSVAVRVARRGHRGRIEELEAVVALGCARSGNLLIPDAQDPSCERRMCRVDAGVDDPDDGVLALQVSLHDECRHLHFARRDVQPSREVPRRDHARHVPIVREPSERSDRQERGSYVALRLVDAHAVLCEIAEIGISRASDEDGHARRLGCRLEREPDRLRVGGEGAFALFFEIVENREQSWRDLLVIHGTSIGRVESADYEQSGA